MVGLRTTCVGVLAVLALGLTACSSTVKFSGESSLASTPKPPPPPAPPPPPPPETHAKVANGKIEIDEKVQFAANADTILAASDNLLKDVAKTFKEHPEIKKVEVQGHASSEGNPARNKALSDLRAKAVMAALIKDGVEASRLTAKGYGSDKPIADNKTDEGREKNRRVEFVIVDPPQAADAKAAEPKK